MVHWIFNNIAFLLEISAVIFGVFYVVAGIYGWITWKNQKQQNEVYQHTLLSHLYIIITGVLLSVGLYFVLSTFFNEAQKPLIDSFTTIFSFIATYLTAKKWIENWIYWIVIDLITTYLYFSRALEIYALLMFFYSFIAIYGYFQWKKIYIQRK